MHDAGAMSAIECVRDLRADLDPRAAKLVKSELHKDLTHLTPHQLGEHLADVLKV